MISQQEKIEQFLKAMNDHLLSLRSQIETETAAARDAEISKEEKEAEENAAAFLKSEAAAARAGANRSLAGLEAELRNTLAARRAQITDSVFAEAAARITEFTKTFAYGDFLKKSAAGIAAAYGSGGVTIFVRPADLPRKDSIRNAAAAAGHACEVLPDETIVLGGCKAQCAGSAVYLDDTLDARLQAQKQEFYENSGLSVLTGGRTKGSE